MAFHSSLETLLRLRKSLERAAWLRLQEVHRAIARVLDEVTGLRRMKEEVRRAGVRAMESGLRGREIHVHYTDYFERRERELVPLMQRLVVDRQKALRELDARRRDREVMEEYLGRKRTEYERERQRKEQVTVDAETLQRRAREAASCADGFQTQAVDWQKVLPH